MAKIGLGSFHRFTPNPGIWEKLPKSHMNGKAKYCIWFKIWHMVTFA